MTDKCCGVSYNPWLPLFCFVFSPRQIHRELLRSLAPLRPHECAERDGHNQAPEARSYRTHWRAPPDTVVVSPSCALLLIPVMLMLLQLLVTTAPPPPAPLPPPSLSLPLLSLSLPLSLCISRHSYGLLVLETFIFLCLPAALMCFYPQF